MQLTLAWLDGLEVLSNAVVRLTSLGSLTVRTLRGCLEAPLACVAHLCFITAGPITKLCAWGEEESGGHVL